MDNQFVDKKISQILKKIGFNEKCIAYYHGIEVSFVKDLDKGQTTSNSLENLYNEDCSAPLHQQVIDWFRTEYNLHIIVEPYTADFYSFNIYYSNKIIEIMFLHGRNVSGSNDKNKTYKSFEEAREVAIQKAIEIIKNKLS